MTDNIGMLVILMLSSYFISHVLISKHQYVRASERDGNEISDLPRREKVEIHIYSLFETLIVIFLLNFSFLIDQVLVANILFAAGAIFLLFSHIEKIKKNTYFMVYKRGGVYCSSLYIKNEMY